MNLFSIDSSTVRTGYQFNCRLNQRCFYTLGLRAVIELVT